MSSYGKINFWLLVVFATVASFAIEVAVAEEPFTLVVLPDTQNYTEFPANRPLFAQETQWLADQILQEGNPRNIQFVSHVGDIVNYGGSLTQWQVANDAFEILDGVAKYSVLPGNHDYALISQKPSGTSSYLDNFGPQRFAGEPWYGGADPSGNNSFQRFSAGGYDFIHLALEWRPTENAPYRDISPIDWAQSVIDANPHTPVILSTHENLIDTPTRRSSFGDDLWNQFVKRNDQVFMVLSGHFQNGDGTDDGEAHQISYNDAGRPVFEAVQNFQDYPGGGQGWLKLFNFDVPNNQIAIETYSTALDQFQTERVTDVGQHASQFEYNIDFASRLLPVINPEHPDLTFQEGIEGYAGTRDKELRSGGNDFGNGPHPIISIDGNDSNSQEAQPNHGLIRFNDLMGSEPGQLGPSSRIERALLVLEIQDAGSGFAVHEMLQEWDENSTWAGFADGVQADGLEAETTPLAAFGAGNFGLNVPVGRIEIDVTATLEAYLEGEQSNHGWVLLPLENGENGIDFYSSEYQDPAVRPTLEVYLDHTRITGDFDGDSSVSSSDFLAWQRGRSPIAYSPHDLAEWQDHYALNTASALTNSIVVPEPTACLLLLAGIAALPVRVKSIRIPQS